MRLSELTFLLPTLAVLILAGCEAEVGAARLTVTTLTVSATPQDGGTGILGGAVDSVWTLPDDPGNGLSVRTFVAPMGGPEAPPSLAGRLVAALARELRTVPVGALPTAMSGSEATTSWSVESPLGSGVTFRTIVPVRYVRRPDGSWYGDGPISQDLVWTIAEAPGTLPDTVRIRLTGRFQEERVNDGPSGVTLEGRGTLRIASLGTFDLGLSQTVETVPFPERDVRARRNRVESALGTGAGGSP